MDGPLVSVMLAAHANVVAERVFWANVCSSVATVGVGAVAVGITIFDNRQRDRVRQDELFKRATAALGGVVQSLALVRRVVQTLQDAPDAPFVGSESIATSEAAQTVCSGLVQRDIPTPELYALALKVQALAVELNAEITRRYNLAGSTNARVLTEIANLISDLAGCEKEATAVRLGARTET